MTARTATVLALIALAGAGCGGGGGDTQTATTPRPAISTDFVGLVSEDAFAAGEPERSRVLAAQHAAGARVLRQVFDWSLIEKRPGRFDFATLDNYVGATARAKLDVLPVLFRPPPFLAAKPAAGAKVTATTTFPPRSPESLARFARAAVERYGPSGTFWADHPEIPKRPIRSWQIWNEPNLPQYWGGRPDVREYVALQRAAYRAIRAADPGAEVVSAGIPNSRQGTPLLEFVREALAAGAASTFDTLAIHPYATSVAGVMEAARGVRRLLGARRTRIWITELGWASGGPRSAFTVGAPEQAQLVSDVISGLARAAPALRLRGVIYFAWRDAPPYAGGHDFWGLHTGLNDLGGKPKPALEAFSAAARTIG